MKKSLAYVFKDSAVSLFENPLLVLPLIIAYVVIILLSSLSMRVNYVFGSLGSIAETIWLIVFAIIVLLVLSYLFAGLIGMCLASIKSNTRARDFFKSANKFWIKNFLVLVIIVLCYTLINLISVYGALLIGKAFSFSIEFATVIFYIIYFACIIFGLIFLTFSNFILVFERIGVWKSIKKSASFVRAHYFYVFLISVIFFFLIRIVSYLEAYSIGNTINLAEIILSMVIYPYLVLVLLSFLDVFSGRKK